eukprot:CAMPEP_0198730146 /NCGR_PEP_ID=MMETSP1475-20131203/23043_1 /TAXON_ID= ORGANISM="Unidentified sp., Strain CCMP1999" /NCGR_SAMPLE_ID=MMETSP1475 /ASSEMBLY_ACC=CAM_ASM_001111 /LENGTH=403 /DNA_ID=CAMNT_0044492917 /DNA_START=104 /DNA_END=1315 /DNA_ORIENTATION=-
MMKGLVSFSVLVLSLPFFVAGDECVPPADVFVAPKNGGEKCFNVQGEATGEIMGTVCIKSVIGDNGQTCLDAVTELLPYDNGFLPKAVRFGVFGDCSDVQMENGTIANSEYQAAVLGETVQPTLRVCLDTLAEHPTVEVESDCCEPELCVAFKAEATKIDLENTQRGETDVGYIVGRGCADIDDDDDEPRGTCDLDLKCAPTPSPSPEPTPPIYPFVNEVRFRPTSDGSPIVDYVELAGSYWNVTMIPNLINKPPQPTNQTRATGPAGQFLLSYILPPTGKYSFYHFVPNYERFNEPGDDITSDAFVTTISDFAIRNFQTVAFRELTWLSEGFPYNYTFRILDRFAPSILPEDAVPLGSGPNGNGLVRVGTGAYGEDFSFEQISYSSPEGTPGPNPGQTITAN